jgi:hypothetical protein
LSAEEVLLVSNGDSLELTYEATNGPTKLWLNRVKPDAFSGKGTGKYPRPNGVAARFTGPATLELVAAASPDAPAETNASAPVPASVNPPKPAAVAPDPTSVESGKEIRVGETYVLSAWLRTTWAEPVALKGRIVITGGSGGTFQGRTEGLTALDVTVTAGSVTLTQEGDSLQLAFDMPAGPAKFQLEAVKPGEFSGEGSAMIARTTAITRCSGRATLIWQSP